MKTFIEYAEEILTKLEPPQIDPSEYRYIHEHLVDLKDVPISPVFGDDIPLSGLPDPVVGAVLSENDRGLLDGLTIEKGLDALAVYKSFRYRNRPPFIGKWGIFIFAFGIDYISDEIAMSHASMPLSERRLRSFFALRDHEFYHFRIDAWAISYESIVGKSKYEEYLHNVYQTYYPNDFVVEETLANLFALARSVRHGGAAWLRKFMKDQPGAYSRLDRNPYQCRVELASEIIDGSVAAYFTGEFAWAHGPFIGGGRNEILGNEACPTYIVNGISVSQVYPRATFLPTLAEIGDKFIPNYLNGKLWRHTDHKYMKIDNGEQVKVPNSHHERVKRSEFANILWKAGMNMPQYRHARSETSIWTMHCPRAIALSPGGRTT